jgi:hypothetical protein
MEGHLPRMKQEYEASAEQVMKVVNDAPDENGQ